MKLNKTLCFAAVTSAMASLSGACLAQSQAAQAPFVATVADSPLLTQAQQKIYSAQRIADRFVAEARRQGLDDNWRLSLLADLMRAPEDQFALVENAQDLNHAIGTASMIARNTRSSGAKSLGGATSDLTFIPINPCRILDTRQGSGTAFVGGDTKVYTFKNTNVGHGSCSVYSDYAGLALPAALAVNITVDESGLSGFPVGKFLAVFPDGGTLGSSFMNFGPGDILANAGIISINQSTGLFDVKSSAPAQVIIDVFGVFLAPLPTALDCVQTTTGTASLGAGQSVRGIPRSRSQIGTPRLSGLVRPSHCPMPRPSRPPARLPGTPGVANPHW